MMTEGETVSALNEDSLFKGAHIAYFSVDTHTHTHAKAAKPDTFTHTLAAYW